MSQNRMAASRASPDPAETASSDALIWSAISGEKNRDRSCAAWPSATDRLSRFRARLMATAMIAVTSRIEMILSSSAPISHRVVGHVINIVAGHHLGPGGIDRVSRQPGPARGGDQPGGDDIARLEPQRPQRDEDEHIQQRRRFQIEGRRLLVLQVEAPDQAEQQAHVEHDRQVQHRRADRAAIGKTEPDNCEKEIEAERPGHRRKIHIRREGLGRCRIEQPEDHHHRKLEPADQAFGRVLLSRDARQDPRGQTVEPGVGIAEPKHGCGVTFS
jgi:hypothetical protein